MANTLHRLEHIKHGFDKLKVALLMSKAVNALVDPKNAKTRNYRNYWMMTQQQLAEETKSRCL